jgi:hypothetical protein
VAILDRILIPSTRWFLRRRINRVIDEIGTRLDIEIRPFQLTKRQVLIDRLAFDPLVIDAVQKLCAGPRNAAGSRPEEGDAFTPVKPSPLSTPTSIFESATGSPKKSPGCSIECASG